MRSIDADALIAWTDNYYDSEKFTVGHFANMVKDMPTIEERKTGKWVDGHTTCSKCGWQMLDDVMETPNIVGFKFCPNCGAKMEEQEDIPMEYFESGGR